MNLVYRLRLPMSLVLATAALPLAGCIITTGGVGSMASSGAPEAPSRLQGRWKGVVPAYDAEGKVIAKYECTLELRDTNTAILTGFQPDEANNVATGTWESSHADRSELELGFPVKRHAQITVLDDTTMKWDDVVTVNGENPSIPVQVHEGVIFQRAPETAPTVTRRASK